MAYISPKAIHFPFVQDVNGKETEFRPNDDFLLQFRWRVAQKIESELCDDLLRITPDLRKKIELIVEHFNALLPTIVGPELRNIRLKFDFTISGW